MIWLVADFFKWPHFSFHLFQQADEPFEVARVGIYVEHLSVAVDETIVGPCVDVKVVLYGTLLVNGQVVVDDVLAREVILLDDVLPRLVTAAVG